MKPALPQNPIEIRKSTRTFQKKPLSSVDLRKISNYLNKSENLVGPFDNYFKFVLLIEPKEQLFFYKEFGQPIGDRAEEFQQALHYVRVGPSAQNKQPWRLVFSRIFHK